MQLPISDQQQPRPYFEPFSHNTWVTDRRTTTVTIAWLLLKYSMLKNMTALYA